MKKIFTIKSVMGAVVIAGILFACKGNKTNSTTTPTMVLSAADSAQIKEFEKWKEKKAENEKRTVVYRDRPVSQSSTASSAPAETKKKGWSKAAKGAVIGGVTGAAAGAIINKKNRGAGAVIGGVIGAGVGYGIGRSQDKKDGRY